jgi:hypothetical protein
MVVCARCGVALFDVEQAQLPCRGKHQGVVHEVRVSEALGRDAASVYAQDANLRPPIECSVCSGRLAQRVSCSCGAVVCGADCAEEHVRRGRRDPPMTHAWAASS